VVEDVLEARLTIKNCTDFLRKEGYTQKQIDAFEEKAENRNLDRIRRTIGHWRAFTLG
jgi:hypoxanthine-guanine phosphoribosyltransferase